MHDALMIYFNGEKNAGLFLAGIGLAELAAAALLFRQDLRSLAATIGVLALAEIALGVGLYLRTDPQVGRLVSQLGAEPARFYTDEGARMARVQRNFVTSNTSSWRSSSGRRSWRSLRRGGPGSPVSR